MAIPFPGGSPGDPGYWEVIFDVIPFPVYVADFASHEIICANRAMRQRVGAQLGDKCYQRIYQQDRPCPFCRMPDLQEAGQRGENFIVFEHFNDTDDCWYQLRETMVTWFDGRRAKYSIAVDIGTLKGAQNALAEAHAELALKNRHLGRAVVQAREAERAKSEFLAVMSHEIRTPMNSILGMVRLLADRPLEAEDREKLEVIRESGDALLSIINDILDFSRLDAGAIEFETTPFDLCRTVGGVVSLMRPRAEEKGLTLALELADDLPAWVCGDAARLRQVLINLVGNAVKFTERGGIIVGAAPVPDDGGLPAVDFHVSDSGIGLDPEQIARLFTPFTQGDASINRRFGGSGLGLAICKKMVEGLGGAIGVDSVPGHGSRFRFRLPFAPAEALAEAAVPVAGTARLPPLSILLAEDNLFNQRVALGLLTREGHRVVIAGNGAEAVDQARRGSFDVVLMDMQMPEVDGPEAARRIRALPGGVSRIPIVALTANAMRADIDVCLAAGMNAHVAKPIDPDELFATVAALLTRSATPARSEADLPVTLAAMVAHFGSAGAADLARTFLDSGDEISRRLAAAIDDPTVAARVAHDLRGLAAYSGTEWLSRLATDLAAAAARGDRVGLRRLAGRLDADWAAARQAVIRQFGLQGVE